MLRANTLPSTVNEMNFIRVILSVAQISTLMLALRLLVSHLIEMFVNVYGRLIQNLRPGVMLPSLVCIGPTE